jgi:hypothetical protein
LRRRRPSGERCGGAREPRIERKVILELLDLAQSWDTGANRSGTAVQLTVAQPIVGAWRRGEARRLSLTGHGAAA